MKKSAHVYSERSRRGFTLIELLIAVTIIAVLATIGISVFIGAQQNARDGKRIADIDAIAKSLEGAKDYTTSDYSYYNHLNDDFKGNIPVDPRNNVGRPNYCIMISGALGSIGDPTEASGISWDDDQGPACPLEWGTWGVVNGDSFATTVKIWKVCAKKEGGAQSIYCRHSLEWQE